MNTDTHETPEQGSARITSELLGRIQQGIKEAKSRRSKTATEQEPRSEKKYYTIDEADRIMFGRFSYAPRTAREYRNNPEYGFPPRIGTAKDRYDARKFDAAMKRFEKNHYGK